MPDPPERLEEKNRAKPSRETLGSSSAAHVFTAEPRLTGRPNGSVRVGRVAIQMSLSPQVPGRPDEK